MENEKCPACGYPNAVKQVCHDPVSAFYECPICGRYDFSETEIANPSLDMKKLGSFLYYKGFHRKNRYSTEYRYHTTLAKEKCDEYVYDFKKGNIEHGQPVHMDNEIINSWYPKSFSEKMDMALLKLDELSDYIGQEITVSQYEIYSLLFIERYRKNGEHLSEGALIEQEDFLLGYLKNAGYIERFAPMIGEETTHIKIKPLGYQKIDQLQRNPSEGRDVLVAMQFGRETQSLREAIKIGIRDAGYNPVLIDEVEHNEFITPELLSYIRRSKFVVVDLTHQNNGAYFEEGYAMGLGKTVIQLCKKDTKLHFDIAQKNTIMWETESEIPLKLKNRITATID